MLEVGRVIGTTTLGMLRFVIKEGMERYVRRDEFISISESVTDRRILGVVKEIVRSNDLLPDEFGRNLKAEEIILSEGEYPVSTVRIIGYADENGLEAPRYGVNPGMPVYLADDDVLKRLLYQKPEISAHIGCISTRENVDVGLSVNELVSKHCAVLAMTGSGKSYAVGVLIEELLKKGGAIIVFDPHGEYKSIRVDGRATKVFGGDEETKLKIESSSLKTSDYIGLIPDMASNQQDLLDEVLTVASKFYGKYGLKNISRILEILYDLKSGDADIDTDVFPKELLEGIIKKIGLSTIGALLRRIKRLERMGIFEAEGNSLPDIASKGQLTVFDLSDFDERISQVVIAAISRRVFQARKSYMKESSSDSESLEAPVLMIVEEAHNFIPHSSPSDQPNVISRNILRRIAREGRKFGVGLCVVSQRPSKLDSDVLSQCNTQIIMKIVNPVDQEYIRQSVENITEEVVRDLPGLSRGEAIVLGGAVKMPVTVRVRERKTDVVGEDIDITGEWNK